MGAFVRAACVLHAWLMQLAATGQMASRHAAGHRQRQAGTLSTLHAEHAARAVRGSDEDTTFTEIS